MRVLLEITNSGRTPRYFFTVADRSPLEAPGQEMKYLLVGTLRPRSSVTGSYSNLCHRRGEHQFGPLWLECSAPFGLLGGHVVGGAHDHAGAGHDGEVGGAGDAEVGEFGGAVGCHEDVRGFDIAMDDAVLVGALEALADLVGDVDGAFQGEGGGSPGPG